MVKSQTPSVPSTLHELEDDHGCIPLAFRARYTLTGPLARGQPTRVIPVRMINPPTGPHRYVDSCSVGRAPGRLRGLSPHSLPAEQADSIAIGSGPVLLSFTSDRVDAARTAREPRSQLEGGEARRARITVRSASFRGNCLACDYIRTVPYVLPQGAAGRSLRHA